MIQKAQTRNIVEGRTFEVQCSLFKKDVKQILFKRCSFREIVFTDLIIRDVQFVNCNFERVFVESFNAQDVILENCKIHSLSLIGERKISSKKLFNSVSDRYITNIRFITSIVDELVIGGNLTINNCLFPEGEWYLHIKKPFQVYQECLRQIDQTWTGEKKQIGLMEIQRMYLDKGVQNQNEDFIFYAENKYIPAEVNETVKSVFLLIRDVYSKCYSI